MDIIEIVLDLLDNYIDGMISGSPPKKHNRNQVETIIMNH